MELKATSCKDAIARYCTSQDVDPADCKEMNLQFQWPPIEKMDASLSTLVACEKLSLSSNMIDKIVGIAGMKNLKILSLARNNIRSIAGVETVADTLEQLWISYNMIEKLKGIGTLKNLRVLYISHNNVKEWSEFNRLQDCPNLTDLGMSSCPLVDNQPEGKWREHAAARLQNLKVLDGVPIIRIEKKEE